MKVVDGAYLAWIFGSSKDRTGTWNRSALIEFSARHPAVIIMEGGKLDRAKFFPAYKENRKDAIKKKPTKLAQRQIDATDKQIDALVYELYGLTEEEIEIVENGI